MMAIRLTPFDSNQRIKNLQRKKTILVYGSMFKTVSVLVIIMYKKNKEVVI